MSIYDEMITTEGWDKTDQFEVSALQHYTLKATAVYSSSISLAHLCHSLPC